VFIKGIFMTRTIVRNIGQLALGFALCTSLTACPQNGTPPPAPPSHNPTPQETYLEHTISFSGETLAEISAWYTGRALNWMAIRDANPSIRPDRLRLGQIILIPRELVINEKPFTRKAGKKAPKTVESAPEGTPTPAPAEPTQTSNQAASEPTPAPVVTEAPQLTPTEAPAATVEPTPEPTVAPSQTPEVAAPKANSKDVEREKLLDELLK